MAITFRHAGAGSGKTYSIEQDIGERLVSGALQPEHLVAVTFTNRAADELLARIGTGLLRRDRPDLAARLDQARIGTVNSVCGQLLQAFCFDLGLSPAQRVITERDQQALFNEALDGSLDRAETAALNAVASRLRVDDWPSIVRSLVDRARSNDFSAAELGGFAAASVAELVAVLPAEDTAVTEAGLRAALEQSLAEAQGVVNPTNGLTGSIDRMQGWLRAASLCWEDWVRVSKLTAGVREQALLKPAVAYGKQVLKCPGFRADLEALIRGLFDAAARSMDAFADLKATRGLVDFVDQEHLMLRALADPGLCERLRARLGFLVVDEFQDTSPIQLALFTRLAGLAREVLFVGDAKQAIYGFRGSDPRLSLDVIRSIQAGGGTLENLSDSWRSRPALVDLVNALFTQPFAHLLTEEQVRLTPRVDPPLDREALGWWTLEGGNRQTRAQALAGGLRGLVADGGLVWDKDLKGTRPVQWRDIAVLCRSNQEAADLAAACAAHGVPSGLARAGLLETPEVTLALACLRHLVDPTDSLAAAEVLSLERGVNAGDWLGHRLDAVAADTQGDWADRASPMLERLAKARPEIDRLSPEEALSTAILAADLHQVVIGWDESTRLTEHRLANLARLAALAREYLDHCRAQHRAGTVAGLILWLRALEQQFGDEQAPNPGNAVSLLTYHSAKGLEWPIVVCMSLNTDLKVSLSGPRVIAATEPFDWKQPLAGRALRYWPDPFPDQKRHDPLTERLLTTPAWAEATRQARNEALQLLYVGMTRARDRLILTEEGKTSVGRWLGLLDSPLWPIGEAGVLALPGGRTVSTSRTRLTAPEPAPPGARRPRHWLPGRSDSAEPSLDYYATPSATPPLAAPTCTLVHDFGRRISMIGAAEMDTLGAALHHALAIALTHPVVERSVIAAVLAQYPTVVLDADEVLDRARELARWINDTYPGATLHCEWPFSRPLPTGQWQVGQIDLVLELPTGWVVIDHKSNPQPRSEWLPLAATHSGQLAVYADALADLSGKPVHERLIHFSVSGGLVRVAA
jgi:ATP-dependent exoDNAse (exonuclease V) beta subunit